MVRWISRRNSQAERVAKMPHMIGPRNQPASSLNEGQARYILIDPALREAGWHLEDRTQVGFEIPVDGYDAEPWNGVSHASAGRQDRVNAPRCRQGRIGSPVSCLSWRHRLAGLGRSASGQ